MAPAKARHAPAVVAAGALLLCLLLFSNLPLGQARAVTMRITNIASPAGFTNYLNGIFPGPGSTSCTTSTTNVRQSGCTTRCLSYTGEPEDYEGSPEFCGISVQPRCAAAPTGGDWCMMTLDIVATFDLGLDTSNVLRVPKVTHEAHPVILITKLSGPTITSTPVPTARWTFQVSSALATYDNSVAFYVAQGSNERVISQSFEFTCSSRRLPIPGNEVVFSPPTVDCWDGTLRANVAVKGCPQLYDAHNSDPDWSWDAAAAARGTSREETARGGGERKLMTPITDAWLDVFDPIVTSSVPANGIYIGGEDPGLSAVYVPLGRVSVGIDAESDYGILSFYNTTGPGQVQLVMRRQLNIVSFPFTFSPAWPTSKTGVRIGFRYQRRLANGTLEWIPSDPVFFPATFNSWILPPAVRYADKDNDGLGVWGAGSKPSTVLGTCDSNDNVPN